MVALDPLPRVRQARDYRTVRLTGHSHSGCSDSFSKGAWGRDGSRRLGRVCRLETARCRLGLPRTVAHLCSVRGQPVRRRATPVVCCLHALPVWGSDQRGRECRSTETAPCARDIRSDDGGGSPSARCPSQRLPRNVRAGTSSDPGRASRLGRPRQDGTRSRCRPWSSLRPTAWAPHHLAELRDEDDRPSSCRVDRRPLLGRGCWQRNHLFDTGTQTTDAPGRRNRMS